MPTGRPRSAVDAVDEARYLAATTNTHRYRIIMRFFYAQHRLHLYALSPEQVQAHVAMAIGGYGEAECQQDLETLARWGNLTQDWVLGLASVRTIDDFRHRNVLYSATPDAILIEELMVRLETRGEQVGQLDGSAIGRLVEDVRRFDEIHEQPDQDDAWAEQLKQAWDDLWRRFAQLADDANSYMANLRSEERERLFDLGAFQIYKDALINYLAQFIDGLATNQAGIDDRARRWDAVALSQTLATAAKAGARSFEALTHLTTEYQGQVGAFQSWFRTGGSAQQLRAFASQAVERISVAARRLSDARRGLVSRAQDLLALADLFSRCDNDAADRVAGLVFGLGEPRQWEYDLPDTVSEQPHESAWAGRAVDVAIRQRRSNSARRADSAAALVEHERLKEALRADARRAEQDAAALFTRLFAHGDVHLSAMDRATPAEAELVLTLVYECLGAAPAHAIRAIDGSRLELTNPDENRYVWLPAGGGRLFVPDYCLRRRRGLTEVAD